MRGKQLHKKNHYVPEMYLKSWADGSGRINTYRTLVPHENVPIWKRHSASAVGYQKHLYTSIQFGVESDAIEKWFDWAFESPAKKPLQKVINEEKIAQEDWKALINFLALQDVRTPDRYYRHRTSALECFSENLNNILEDLVNSAGSESLRMPTLIAGCAEEYMPLKVVTKIEDGATHGTLRAETYAGRATWLFAIKHLLNNTSKVLHDHQWTIIKPAEGFCWPTSDNPVVRLNYSNSNSYDLNGGWGENKGNIIFPVGPEHAMFVQVGDRPPSKNQRQSESFTKFLIKIISENSRRLVFSRNKCELIQLARSRLVDSNRCKFEVTELDRWHEENSRMEREYLSVNRPLNCNEGKNGLR